MFVSVLESQRAILEDGCHHTVVCRLKLKWSQDKSIRKVFTCFVCVDDEVRLGVEPWRGCILAEELKIDIFLALSGRERRVVQTLSHSSVHMTRRFVIQGCLP